MRELEQTLAILEEGAETICTSSGMAAVNVVFFGLLSKVPLRALAHALWSHDVTEHPRAAGAVLEHASCGRPHVPRRVLAISPL